MYVIQILMSLHMMEILFSFQLSGPNIPNYLCGHQIGYNNQTTTVYLFGGNEPDHKPTNKIYKLNMSNTSAKWITLDINTTSVFFFCGEKCSVTIDHKVYFVGINDNFGGRIYTFDLHTEQFNTIVVGGYPIEGCVVTNNTHIFQIGGLYNGSHVSNRISIFNTQTNEIEWNYTVIDFKSWRQICAIVDNTIYVFGGTIGYIKSNESNTIHKYYTLSMEWTFIGNLNRGVSDGYAVYSTIDNNIYILWYTMMIFNVEQEEIINEVGLIINVTESPMLIYNQTLVIFGGLYKWNPSLSTTWLQISAIPLNSSYSPTCSNDHNLLEWVMITIVTFIAISCCLLAYYYRKKYVAGKVVFSNVSVNEEPKNIYQSNNREASYHSISSATHKHRIM
eukprot:472010_1